MRAAKFFRLPTVLLSLGFAPLATAFTNPPYTPVQLLSTGQHASQLVYILEPPQSAPPSGQLRLLKPSSRLAGAALSPQTLGQSLPFLAKDPSLAYEASLDKDGKINVVVSDCSRGADGSLVWTYSPNAQDTSKYGSWSQMTVGGSSSASPGQTALNYLAQSLTFAPTDKSNSTIYTFGGMCPFANATVDDWVSAASYSDKLVVLNQDSASAFGFKLGTARGQPIAEAGFSLTPLLPSFTNNTDGSRATSQSFLLLGGQTRDAFINMSQVALFSLPQASWTFLPVGIENAKTDLKAREPLQPAEPRSGHISVLTSDGSKVIMFGGWVGDTSSPAEPQLAILNVGAGFGGNGGWSWAEEPTQPSFSQGSSGLYGHGATMLDGDVLMVYGGNSIASSDAYHKSKRASGIQQAMFYNVSSNSWTDSYDPSKVASTNSAQGDSTSDDRSKDTSVGLGVGLSCGFVAVFAACWAGYVLLKRSRAFNEPEEEEDEQKRGQEIEDLGAVANSHQEKEPDPFGGAVPGAGPLAGQIWDGRDRTYDEIETEPGVWVGDSVRDAERTGYSLEIPSPQRGLRRSLAGRAGQSGARHVRRASGSIPRISAIIEEEDEEEEAAQTTPSRELDDPFRDPDQSDPRRPTKTPPPMLGVLPTFEPLGSTFVQTMSDMSRWINDLGVMAQDRAKSEGEITPERSGRASPERSDRTLSSLSEMSIVSHMSRLSDVSVASVNSLTGLTGTQRTIVSPRSPIRPARIIPPALNIFGTASAPSSPTRSSPDSLQRTPRSAGPFLSTDDDSFTTAPSSFPDLQAESDALLGPARPGQASALHMIEPDEEPTFTRANGRRAPSSRIGGWVGSVRRVIQTAGRTTNMALTPARSESRNGNDGLGGLMVYETRGSATSSPTKKGGVSELAAQANFNMQERDWQPRRSASDGAGLFTAKRGAKDWGVEPDRVSRPRSHTVTAADSPERTQSGSPSEIRPGEDEDWDVEAAVKDRNVQIMFSVPREKLRVVNADVEPDDTSLSEADGAEDYGRH